MKIVVLAKQVPDTWSDRKIDLESGLLDRAASEPVPDEINERALENALAFKDENKDTEIVVVAMGPEDATKTLRKLLSMGADSAVLVSDAALAGHRCTQPCHGIHRVGRSLELDRYNRKRIKRSAIHPFDTPQRRDLVLDDVCDLFFDTSRISACPDGSDRRLRDIKVGKRFLDQLHVGHHTTQQQGHNQQNTENGLQEKKTC